MKDRKFKKWECNAMGIAGNHAEEAITVIAAGNAPTTDIRMLRLATQYPWMFSEPHLGMEMRDAWFAVFEELCADISTQLGPNKRGIHWRQLTCEGNRPFWYWRLGEEMDLCVAMVRSITGPSFKTMNPAADPQNKLRDAISKLVKGAQARAYVCGMLSIAKGEQV